MMFDDAADIAYLAQAFQLAHLAPPSDTAFSVGCVIVAPRGDVLASGYSREWGEAWHAEEVAIAKARASQCDFASVVLYSSLEPCSVRKSGRISCCDRIIHAGIRYVVFGAREPSLFVIGEGEERLRQAAIEVKEIHSLDDQFEQANRHLRRRFVHDLELRAKLNPLN